MEFLILAAPLLAGLLGIGLLDNSSETEDPEPIPEPEPETSVVSGGFNDLSSGNDTLTIDNPDFHGAIRGGEGNDTITVLDSADWPEDRDSDSPIRFHNNYGQDPLLNGFFPEDSEYHEFGATEYFEYHLEHYSNNEDGVPELHEATFEYSGDEAGMYGPQDAFDDGVYPIDFLTEIHGGEGEDLIRIGDGYFFVDPGPGADTIELNSDSHGFFNASDGDSLYVRSEDASAIFRVSGLQSGGILFDGSMSNASSDNSVSADGASTLIGGDGDDWFMAYDEGADVTGGGGDDRIFLNPGFNPGQTATNDFDFYSGEGSGVANGGAGDDVISFDHGDTVTGGEGNDSLIGYLKPGETAIVTDFNADEDFANIQVNTDRTANTGNSPVNITTREIDGGTEILQQGQVIARFEGATGLVIAMGPNPDDDPSDDVYTDLDGNPINLAMASVVISEFVETSS